jgi:hypothetical protein
VALNLSGVHVSGPVTISNAKLNAGIQMRESRFEGPVRLNRCDINGDFNLSQSVFTGPFEVSWSSVRGRLYCWRSRFAQDAKLFQVSCSPGHDQSMSFLHQGEVNFSWSHFRSTASFERCHFNGPAYFWRTRFFDRCSFNETSFGADATFMGKHSEVCLSRQEIGWEFFTRLEAGGLLRPDHEACAILDGREWAMFGQLAGIESAQELQARMCDAGLSDEDRARLERLFEAHAGPMFRGHASLQNLRIAHPKQVKFIAVNAEDWDLANTNADAISFFNSNHEPVPVAVGLGHMYESVFISYGGPDEPVARKFNQALLRTGVNTFFYPEHALIGGHIPDEMKRGVASFDRVLLIVSESAPSRPGWRFEVREGLQREQQNPGTPVLLPVAIDGGLWSEWPPDMEPIRKMLLDRNVADFRSVINDAAAFNEQLGRLLHAVTVHSQPGPSSRAR